MNHGCTNCSGGAPCASCSTKTKISGFVENDAQRNARFWREAQAEARQQLGAQAVIPGAVDRLATQIYAQKVADWERQRAESSAGVLIGPDGTRTYVPNLPTIPSSGGVRTREQGVTEPLVIDPSLVQPRGYQAPTLDTSFIQPQESMSQYHPGSAHKMIDPRTAGRLMRALDADGQAFVKNLQLQQQFRTATCLPNSQNDNPDNRLLFLTETYAAKTAIAQGGDIFGGLTTAAFGASLTNGTGFKILDSEQSVAAAPYLGGLGDKLKDLIVHAVRFNPVVALTFDPAAAVGQYSPEDVRKQVERLVGSIDVEVKKRDSGHAIVHARQPIRSMTNKWYKFEKPVVWTEDTVAYLRYDDYGSGVGPLAPTATDVGLRLEIDVLFGDKETGEILQAFGIPLIRL